MRTMLRGKVTLLFLTCAVLLAIPAVALADIVHDEVNAVETNVNEPLPLTVGQTKTVNYWIERVNAATTDGDGGCNIDNGEQLYLKITSASPAVANAVAGQANVTELTVGTPGVKGLYVGPFTACDDPATVGTRDGAKSADIKGLSVGSANFSVSVPASGATATDATNTTVNLNTTGVGTYDVTTDGTFTALVTPPPNTAPVANNDALTTDEDTAGNVNVLTNDTDADGNTLKVTGSTNGTNGSVSCTEAGVCTYTPTTLNFNGSDSFTYTVSDGTATATGTVNVTINAVNDTPTITNIANEQTNEDIPTGAISFTVGDVETAAGSLQVSGSSDNTTLVPNANIVFGGSGANRTVTITPAADKHGTANITVEVSDGSKTASDSFQLTVNPVNDKPVAAADAATTDEDIPVVIDVKANDTDVDGDSLSVVASSLSDPANGTVELITAAGTDQGKVRYTPDPDYNNTAANPDTFTYKVNDGTVDSDAATVSVTVDAVNDEPTAVKDTATTAEDTPVDIPAADLLANDSTGPANESGQELYISAVSNSQNGQAVLSPDRSKVTFTPAQDFYGEASFDYTVCDDGGTANNGQNCFQGTAIVKVTVSPVNDAPVAVSDPGNTTNEDTATNINVIANDTDVDNTNAQLSVSSFDATSAQGGTVSKNAADGTLKYQPAANYNGPDSFKYRVSDGSLNSTNEATVSITVNEVNDEPSFTKGADQTVLKDAGAQTVTGWATAISAGPSDENGQNLTFEVTNNTNTALFSVQPAISSTGTLTYTPAPNTVGTAKVTVTLEDDGGTLNGGDDTSEPQTFNINVTYKFDGFRQPVDMKDMNGNYIFNAVKAGQSIPMKFSLFGNQGLSILQPSTTAAPNPKVTAVTCPGSSTLVDQIEQTTTANNGLTYDATIDQYNYVWKTQSGYGGKCYQFDMVLIDGTHHVAYFKFTK